MLKIFLWIGVFTLTALPGRASASPRHELYLCATTSLNYIVGARMITPSGLYHREQDGSYRHFGVNFPGIFSLAVDPRDHRRLYVASLNGALCSADGGQTWRIGTSWDMTEPKDIFVDPKRPGQRLPRAA